MRSLKILVQITNRENSSLNKYFNEVNNLDMISAEEETKLAVMIRGGDTIALEKLTLANLRFVISVAKQYVKSTHNLSLGDLISEGNLGLIKAATRFDETRGFKFISYAVWWIRQSIMASISQNSRLIRQPFNRISQYHQALRTFASLEQKNQREPTDEEIAEALQLDESHISEIMSMGIYPKSVQAPINQEDTSSFIDLLADPNAPSPEGPLMQESLKSDLNLALATLNNRESSILRMFFGLDNGSGMTITTIAAKLGLSCERVRQIKDHALKELRLTSPNINLLRTHLG